VHRQHNYTHLRQLFDGLVQDLKAVQFRHCDIEQDQVGSMLSYEAHCFPAITRPGYDFYSVDPFDERANSCPYKGVIVCE